MPILPDSNLSNLQTIQQKVRRITRSPSPSQLSDTQLNAYINSAILYDFPNHLRLFSLRTNFTWYTQPNIDTYTTNTTNVNDPFYNFNNKYIAVHQPLFIAGVQCNYSQWPDDFFGYWPNTVTHTMSLVSLGMEQQVPLPERLKRSRYTRTMFPFRVLM